jgi:hypothetical protein
MAKAQWTTNPREVTFTTGDDGTFVLEAPLYDDRVRQGTLRFVMSAGRHLRVEWLAEPGAEGLAGFEAWSKEA